MKSDQYAQQIFRSVFSLGFSQAENDLPRNLSTTFAVDGLSKIKAADKNMLIYFWQPSQGLDSAIRAKPYHDLPEWQESFSLQGLQEYFAAESDPLLRQLFDEMKTTFDEFLDLVPGQFYKLTFARPEERMCPLFHVDKLSLRLLVTLRGAGTQWLDDQHVQRKALGKGKNADIVSSEALVHELKTYQVGVFKGEEFPGNRGRAVVHRSPLVAADGEGRWLLRIDCRRGRLKLRS